jgi:hypothetical protein
MENAAYVIPTSILINKSESVMSATLEVYKADVLFAAVLVFLTLTTAWNVVSSRKMYRLGDSTLPCPHRV